MALSDTDSALLDRLLLGQPDAWTAFVDRWIGLISHVVGFSADCRGVRLSAADREDLVAEVFVALLERDMATLRGFERRSSLATYLSVVARRVVVRRLMRRSGQAAPLPAGFQAEHAPSADTPVEQRVADEDQVAKMLGTLPANEAQVVRMFHLEGRSYNEISRAIGVPENTIGPVLSRARTMLRRMGEPT